MKRWGIQTRMNLLAVGPATVMAGLLLTYFIVGPMEDASPRLTPTGTATAQQFATAAEYGVVTDNYPLLQQLVEGLVTERHAQYALVIDGRMRHLAQAGMTPISWDKSLRTVSQEVGQQEDIYVLPIQSSVATPLAFQTVSNDVTQFDNSKPNLGWAIIAMPRTSFAESKKQILLTAMSMVLSVLAIALLLGVRLGRGVCQPIRKLSQVIDNLAQGNLAARVAQNSGGELLLLQQGLNGMARAFQARQNELEQRILATTRDLQAKHETLEQSKRIESDFIASVSHDLRQPMHAIGIFADTLRHRVNTHAQRELVQRIEDSVTTLQSMFDGLVNLFRMDAGLLEPNTEACDLSSILKRIGQEFQPMAEQKGLNLRIHVCPEAWVKSDSVLLGHLFQNIVVNALRYTEHGGVLLACHRRQAHWVVQIWDTGIGIAEEHQTKIFDAYYQVENAERNSAQGVGLGLAIAAGIARLLKCKLEVYSRLGRGSVFNIILPISETSEINHDSNIQQSLGQFNAERVLVIEDDQAARESLQGLLSSWGLSVLSVADYDQASQCVAQNPGKLALIISDYRLPQKNGVDSVATLRARLGADVQAILMCGDTTPESMAAMQASGLPVLYKPVRPAKLRALVTSLLTRGNGAAQ